MIFTSSVRVVRKLAALVLFVAPSLACAQFPLVTSEEVGKSLNENRAAWRSRIDAVGRPRLLYDKAQLAELKTRLTGGVRPPEAVNMLAQAYRTAAECPHPYVSPEEKHAKTGETFFSANGEEWVRTIGDGVTLLAVAAALDPSRTLKKALHDETVALCSYPSWGRKGNLPEDNMDLACGHAARAVALAWDWHPDLWTPADRDLILQTITARAGALLRGLYGQGYWAKNYADNHNHIDCNGLAWCGLAFYADIPQAPEWLAAARLDFQNVVKYCNADGSSAEGVPYWSYGTTFVLQYIEGTKGVIDSAKLYDCEYLKHSASFRLHVSTSGLGGTLTWGDAPSRDYAGPHHLLSLLANQYKDPSAAWLAHRIPWPLGGLDTLAWGALWRCDDAPRPPLPLDNHLSVADIVTTRSGWGAGDYLLCIKSGFTNRNHSHLDAGALALAFGAEWLLTTPGYGKGKNDSDYWDFNNKRWTYYANATESHCTLLINGKNQRFDHEARGTVDRFLSVPQGSFTGINLTGAYADADSVRREVLHRRGDYILVFDAVRSNQPASVEWLAQFPTDPEKQQNALGVKGEAGQLRVEMLAPAVAFAPRTPTSAHVDVAPQHVHPYTVKREGTAVDFVALLQPGFSPDNLPTLKTTLTEQTPGVTHIALQGTDWTDHVFKNHAAGPATMDLPSGDASQPVKATANLLSVRTDAQGVQSALAVGATALALPGFQFKATGAPTEIGLQKMPDGSWILDAGRDIRNETNADAALTIQPLEPAAAGTSRYLLARGSATRRDAAEWLASLLVFHDKSPLSIRALATQPPLPAPVVVPVAAVDFTGQQRGNAEVVEGKPGSTGGKSVRGFGNGNPDHVVNWTFDAPQAGQYLLTIRYATELPDVQLSLLLDGAVPAPELVKFALPETGGWSIKADNWKTRVVSDAQGKPLIFNLAKGKHELRLANPTGALALDRFEFKGTGQ